MTRQERAYVKRLEKRNDSLLSVLCIIQTWLGFPDDPTTRCYHIGKLCTEHIEAEREARRKEGGAK